MVRLRLVELPVPAVPGDETPFLDAAATAPLPDVFVLPELFSTGYVMDRIGDLAVGESLEGSSLPGFCGAMGVWCISGTHAVSTGAGLANRLHVISPAGSIAHHVDKVHLFGMMGEDRVFTRGGASGPFDLPWGRAGAMICYDLRFPELARGLVLDGAAVLFVAAHWPFVRSDIFRCLLQARAAEAQVFVAGCNIGGSHLGIEYRGGGGVAGPMGLFLHGEDVAEGVRDFELDMAEVPRARQLIDCLGDRRPEVYR